MQAPVMSGTGGPVSQELEASERRFDGAYNGRRMAASAGVFACRSSRQTHAGTGCTGGKESNALPHPEPQAAIRCG